jgi:dCMP deaminase
MKAGPRIVPSRDEKYMGEAFHKSRFSKDPNTQMGAVIIGADNSPISSGYNGPPAEMDDDLINWGREPTEDSVLTKYDFMIHAEKNAIQWAKGDPLIKGSTMYVTGLPCKFCIPHIIHAGIAKVIYFPHKSKDSKSMFSDKSKFEKTFEMAQKGNVILEEFKGNLNHMRDDMVHFEQLGIFK